MTKYFLIVAICSALLLICGCTDIHSYESEEFEDEPYYLEPYDQLSKANVVNGLIQFVNPIDNKLYALSNDGREVELVFDIEMQLFTYTNAHLVYIDVSQNLVLYNLKNGESRTFFRDGEFFSSSIIYEDRIVFISKDRELIVMAFDGHHIAKIGDYSVKRVFPYNKKICYVISNDRLDTSKSMSIMLMDVNGGHKTKLVDQFVYGTKVKDDWIYYVSDKYILEGINGQDSEETKKITMVDLFDWGIGDDFVVSNDMDGMFICDLNGRSFQRIDGEEKLRILAVGNDVVVYWKWENENAIIYHVGENAKYTIELQDKQCKVVILENYIYVVFGHSTGEGYVETGGGFYTYEGEIIYSFEA